MTFDGPRFSKSAAFFFGHVSHYIEYFGDSIIGQLVGQKKTFNDFNLLSRMFHCFLSLFRFLIDY